MTKRQPKRYALENRIATMEASLRMLHTKLDELLSTQTKNPDEDWGLKKNEPVKQVVTQRIGPWKFDVTDYAEVQSNVVLSTALSLLFRDIDNEKVVPVSWDVHDMNAAYLAMWLRTLSGTHYLAFDVSDGVLVLVEMMAGMTDKTKMTELGELLAEVAETEHEEVVCIGNPSTNH